MVDIWKCFKNGYLRKVDRSNALVSCVYGIAHTTTSEISSLKIPEADAFLDRMYACKKKKKSKIKILHVYM